MNRFPIYIPSKNRSDVSGGTAELLMKHGMEFSIVVEPQEVERYEKRYGHKNVLMLPANDQGIAFSRSFIKKSSSSVAYHWQLDDDIRSFVTRFPGQKKTAISPVEALDMIESEVLKYTNIGIAGTNQNSWPPGSQKTRVNSLPVQCILINNLVKADYRKLKILEDMDFTLQVLTEGYCSLLFDWVRTNTPPIGSNAGGLNQVYKNIEDIRQSMYTIIKSFPVLSYEEDDKGPHLRRNRIWSTFKQRPIPVSSEIGLVPVMINGTFF